MTERHERLGLGRLSRKAPYLPVIRMSDGVLRYSLSEVEEFVNERERASVLRKKRL